MFELLKEKAKADQPMNADDFLRISGKVKKTSEAGPGYYKVEQALEWSAKTRSSIKNEFSKAKNMNYLSKFFFWNFTNLTLTLLYFLIDTHLKHKKIIPGVG